VTLPLEVENRTQLDIRQGRDLKNNVGGKKRDSWAIAKVKGELRDIA